MEDGLLLRPSGVVLDLAAATRDEAVLGAAGLLRDDPRVTDWDGLWASIGERQRAEPGTCGVCLAHGRGGMVRKLVLSAARLARPVPGERGPLQLVFVFGIPAAMAGEYLRVVGALARACGSPSALDALLEASTPEAFAAAVNNLAG